MLLDGFSYLTDPRILLDIKYASSDNFLGRKVKAYVKPICILSTKAMDALILVQDQLTNMNADYHLKIFDAYRPQTAVEDFKTWAQDPNDTHKNTYYPDHTKSELFDLGYIASHSEHTRGSAIDLTVCLGYSNLQELNMGTIFDFFGERSHTAYPGIPQEAKDNRQFLNTLMEKHGFINFEKEWWHFRLKDEAFPNTYFDFPVE